MSDDNLLEPKIHRSKTEIGRQVRNLVRKHGAVRVVQGENEYDIEIYVDEDE